MVVPFGHLRIVVRNDADFPCGRARIFSADFGGKWRNTRRQTSCTTTGWKIEKQVAKIVWISMPWVIFVLHSQNFARNPLIVPHGIRWLSMQNPLSVRAESADLSARIYADGRTAICGLSARSSAEKVKFSVSCTIHEQVIRYHKRW